MKKRRRNFTPLEALQALGRAEIENRQAEIAASVAEIERHFAECESLVRAKSDPTLSVDQRSEIFKGLQSWPRIVLGLYRAELALAQKQRYTERKEKRVPKIGREEPSEIARDAVAEALGLGPDRIRDLCREGDRHLKQGMPPQPEISVAEFKRQLSTVVPKEIADLYRESFSADKLFLLSHLFEKYRKPL
jgi:hypothetical protein